MANSGNWGRGIIGPNIPLDGLTVYYDFSNPRCYSGTGTVVNNLAPYPEITASLSGSIAGGTPSFVSDGAKSYVSFVSSSEQSMFYTLPTWGTSFTQICVYASPTSTWDGQGDIGGNRVGPGSLTSNGWVLFINNPGDDLTGYAIELATVAYDVITVARPNNLTIPGFYVLGYDNPTDTAIVGLNSSILDSVRSSTSRSPINNSQVYFARLDPKISALGFGPRFTSVKLYFHMLYNRKLSVTEANNIYILLKSRFNF